MNGEWTCPSTVLTQIPWACLWCVAHDDTLTILCVVVSCIVEDVIQNLGMPLNVNMMQVDELDCYLRQSVNESVSLLTRRKAFVLKFPCFSVSPRCASGN